MRMNKAQPFADVKADFAPDDYEGEGTPRVFSEAFLYPTLGKGDARFVLAVAREYTHIINALGPRAVAYLLDVRPQLTQRLGIPDQVVEALKDAISVDLEQREDGIPFQAILDRDAADDVWQMLHDEYRRLYDPEKTMPAGPLRAYNALTEALGEVTITQRQQERDRLPAKLEAQAKRRAELEIQRAARTDRVQLIIDAAEVHGVTLDKASAAAIERTFR